MDRFEAVLQVAPRGRIRSRNIVIPNIGWDVPLLHRVHDRLHMAGAERHVVRDGCNAGRVEVDRGCRGAARWLRAQRRIFELEIRLDVEILAGVILQRLVDDGDNLVLGQRQEFSGIGTFCSSPRLFILGFLTVAREVGLSFRFRVARSWVGYCWDSPPSL